MNLTTEGQAGTSLYMNRPQLVSNLMDARIQAHVWGRGTGKSSGALSHRAHRCMSFMPRSTGANVAESYMQLLDRTMPPIKARWQEMGLQDGVDFWFRKSPPKNAGLRMPYVMPETPEHCVFMRVNRYDVSLMQMVSQDRPGSSNGMSNVWMMGDETRFLDYTQLKREFKPTLRGNRRYFGDCHLYRSEMYTTDMPTEPGAKWIHEYEDYMDPAANELILAGEKILFDIRLAATKRGRYTQNEIRQIESINRELSLVRKDLIFYSEASSLDNIDVLGEEYIRDLKRDLTDFEFETSVANIRPSKGENAFYPDLADRHFYNALDYSFVDGQPESDYGKGKLNDCRKDLDLNRSMPLEAALDVGGKINTLACGQEMAMTISLVNAMDVLHPNKIADLARQFDKYYRYYPKKEVIVYYDHTHVPRNPVSDKNPIDEFVDTLADLGWAVTKYPVGVTPSYYNRYKLWTALLTGQRVSESEFYQVRFNKENCKTLKKAMNFTHFTLNGKTGFEKNKKMEKDTKADQRDAPHYSDAADLLVYGMIKRRRQGRTPVASVIDF
ncbi:hypothetical protein LZD49_12460 [Dyadobacter sp. CY261]|uniref:hypothetical protein n=1 Tax=Dyadobacter sp. CY261 TaxID=2907203 RepID=UPI001F3433D7|nr:hypothetical protein [Dyadobacter sp. CY261]MCF0071285.1 hypothetical protein [Dyadobacter sp. CY261]